MKRQLAIALVALLAALPSGAATVWVSPVRGTSLDSTTYSGADSTDANARSLAWFNARAKPGDVCLAKSGIYPSPIRPVNSGTGGSRITYIGDISVPGSRVLAAGPVDNPEAVDFDSVTSASSSSGWRNITVKGFGSAAGVSITVLNNTAANDSILNCAFDAGLDLTGASSTVVRYCRIGTGDATDKLNVAHGNGNPYHTFISGVKILDCTFNLGCGAKDHDGNAMTHRWEKSGAFQRNRTTLRKWNSAYGDSHLNTWYSCQDMDVSDNLWQGSADGYDPEYYILNVRDFQIANRWVRDTLVEMPGSVRPLKFAWMTSGDTDVARDPGSHNNLWNSNVVKVRGVIEYQEQSPGDVHLFNTYITGEQVWLANCQTGCSKTFDSLTFTHNTVVSTDRTVNPKHPNVVSDNRITNSRVTQNIFYATAPANCGHIGYFNVDPGGTLGPVDSNLVWCGDPRDSLHAIAIGVVSGGESRPLRSTSNGLTNDQASWWGDPQFTDTTSVYTFNVTPDVNGLAVSRDLWADGFVGAIDNSTPADETAPAVTLVSPAESNRIWLANDYMRIQWTATDGVGVASANVYYAKTSSPTTWRPIVLGASGAVGDYTWRIPNLRTSSFAIRVAVYDAAGNEGSAAVANHFYCPTCDPDEPFFELP